jgi:hypothetical protein
MSGRTMKPTEFWKNFRLEEELSVSGTFIYNGLKRFHGKLFGILSMKKMKSPICRYFMNAASSRAYSMPTMQRASENSTAHSSHTRIK